MNTSTGWVRHVVHGTAQHTNVQRDLHVEPANFTSGVFSIAPSSFIRSSVRFADGATQQATFVFKVPSDFVSFVSAQFIIIPNASGNLCWLATANWAAIGEAENNHTAGIAVTITAVTQFLMNAVDASALFAAPPILGDIIGVMLQRNGGDVLDTINNVCDTIAMIFTYIAEQ